MSQAVQSSPRSMGKQKQEIHRPSNGKTVQGYERSDGAISIHHASDTIQKSYRRTTGSWEEMSQSTRNSTCTHGNKPEIHSDTPTENQNSRGSESLKRGVMLRSTPIFLFPLNCHYHHASSTRTSTSTSTSNIASTRSHASSTQSASTHAHHLCLPFTTRGPHSSTCHTAQSHHRQPYPTATRRTRHYGCR